jgi:hypothetical protein
MTVYFFAVNNIGPGLSGGDSIWMNLAKHWRNKAKICVIGSFEALSTLNDTNIPQIKISPKIRLKTVFSKSAIAYNTLFKLFYGMKFVIKNHKMFKDNDIIYSVSDFYPDFIPCLILKLIRPKLHWVAGFYLFAPSPADSPYRQDFFRGFAYWLSQRVSYPPIKRFADCVFVTSDIDRDKFPRTVVVRGGV